MKRCLFLNLLFIQGLLWAQPYTTFNYSLDEGMPSSEVYQVYQDKGGFIWFATDNGIARFDGSEIKPYHIKDGLSDPVVFNFQEDDAGRVWFNSYSGRLSYYENGEIKKYKYNEKILRVVENGIPNFYYDATAKKLYISSKLNYGEIDSTGNLKQEKIKNGGLLYFGTLENGVWSISTHTYNYANIYINGKNFEVPFSPDHYLLKKFLGPARSVYWRGKRYLTIRNNIFCYDGNTVKRVYAGRGPIICLSKDKHDNLWIGYMTAGAEKHTQEDFSEPIDLPILKDLSISWVLEDNNNGLWFSTLENGVYHVPNPIIINASPTGNSKIMHVFAHGDSVYKSNHQGEFTILNAKNGEPIWSKKFDSPANYFYQTKSGMLILLSGPETYFYDRKMQLIRKYPINVSSIIEQKNGGFWTYGDGAIREFDKDGVMLTRTKLSELYRSFTLHDSLFYMAGRTGLQIRNLKYELVASPLEMESLKISQLISLNPSKLLIATLGSGLIIYDTQTGSHQKFDTENLFIANSIYTAVRKKNTLWMGSEVGLISLNIESLLNGVPDFKRWDKRDGLIADDIKHLGVTSTNVWAFADEGYSVIPLTQLSANDQRPTPYLVSLQINDTIQLQGTQGIKLPFNKTNISVQIGFLSFTKQDIKSRYRLSKHDKWIYSGERTFQFNSLAPADYSFELEYTIDNVNWIPVEISFNFSVIPPWWQQWYFQIGSVLIIVVIILLYTWRQINNYKQKNHYLNVINQQQQKLVKAEVQITERERKRIAKELHDGVGTDLVLVKLKVMELLSKNGDRSSNKGIDEQFNETIQEIRNISYGLTPPDLDRFGLKKTLTNYINKLSFSTDTKIHLDFKGEVGKGEVEISIFRVIQELISNTVKHANAKNIVINIEASPEAISISYIDDGVGFSYSRINHGLGLANIESRIQSIGGRIHFESNHTGTTYLILIPEAI